MANTYAGRRIVRKSKVAVFRTFGSFNRAYAAGLYEPVSTDPVGRRKRLLSLAHCAEAEAKDACNARAWRRAEQLTELARRYRQMAQEL